MTEYLNTIKREMIIDLIYRLRLVDDLFCQATDQLMSAMSMEDAEGKKQAVQSVRDYSKALQVVYADLQHIIDGRHIVFPAEISVWQWNEPNGEDAITMTVERLHAIAEGMEMKLNAEFLQKEVHK